MLFDSAAGRLLGPPVEAVRIVSSASLSSMSFKYSRTPFVISKGDWLSKQQLGIVDGRPQQLSVFVWRVDPDSNEPVPCVVWDYAGSGMGVGVYAWRKYQKGDVIGVYVGNCLTRLAPEQFSKQLPSSRDALIVINRHLIDGKCDSINNSSSGLTRHDPALFPWPGMGAHLVNGARGNRPANAQVTEPLGFMQAISDITAVYDPLSFCLPEAERVALNAPAQLFWEYGLRYWGNTSVQVHSTARRSMGRSGSGSGGGSSPRARPSEVGQW
jgi:hypothetical protein